MQLMPFHQSIGVHVVSKHKASQC